MDPDLEQQLRSVATSTGLLLDSSVATRLDKYINKHFQNSSPSEQTKIRVFLANSAFQIAKGEGKRHVEEDDVKAAIWYFHVPDDPTDPCRKAGEYILDNESRLVRQLPPQLRSIVEESEGGAAAI